MIILANKYISIFSTNLHFKDFFLKKDRHINHMIISIDAEKLLMKSNIDIW